MRVAVMGATGPTGEQIVGQALAAGHEVTALVRRPEAVAVSHPSLRIVAGIVTSEADVRDAIAGTSAVLSALGSREMSVPTAIYSAAAVAALSAMHAAGVRRYLAVSAVPAAPEETKGPLGRYVVHPLLYRFFGGAYDDMRRMEALVAASDLDWTIFRPPRLTHAPSSGRFRTAVDASLPRALSISRADLAAAMLGAIDDTSLYRHAVTIAA